MIHTVIFLLLINFFSIAHSCESKQNIITKHSTLEYDQQGYPTPRSLKNYMLLEYFSETNPDLITIEKISQADSFCIYAVKIENVTVAYVKIINDAQDGLFTTIDNEELIKEIKKSDNKDIYPFFIPDNLPISIWIEDLFSYQDQHNTKKVIAVFSIAQI